MEKATVQVVLNPGEPEVPGCVRVVALRDRPGGAKLSWIDRAAASAVAAQAGREGFRILASPWARRAFEFLQPGTRDRVSRPEPDVWYETWSVGSLPNVELAWYELGS